MVADVIDLNFFSFDPMELKQAASDAVDIVFLNDQYCGFRTYLNQSYNYCLTHCDIDAALGNLEKRALVIVTKLTIIMDMFTRRKGGERQTFNEILETTDAIGESLGAILSGLIDYK